MSRVFYLSVLFFHKWPHWLRWILIPFAVVFAYILASVFINILSWFQTGFIGATEDSWFNWLHQFILLPALTCYLSTVAGAAMAPKFKFIASLVIGAIFVLISGSGVFFYMAIKTDYSMLFAMLASAVGAGAAILQMKEEQG